MMVRGFKRGHSSFEPPIEMRFVDLFMIIVAALMFITVMLSIISAFVGSVRIDVAPQVATRTLPIALLNQPYFLTLAGTGGTNPYTWSLASGSLPAGLTLDPTTGTISGTPLRVQRTQFSIQLTDSEHRSVKRDMVLTIASTVPQLQQSTAQLRIISDSIILPDAVNGTAYTFHFSINGGSPPYQWTLIQGTLPSGMHLTPTGDVVGIPSQENTSWLFTVKAVDANGISVTQHARLLVVSPPPTIWDTIWIVVFWVSLAMSFLFGGPGIINVIRGFLARRRNR